MAQATWATQQAASSEMVSRYRHINDDQKQSMRVWTVLRIHCARLVRLRKKPLTSAFSKRNTRQLAFHCRTAPLADPDRGNAVAA